MRKPALLSLTFALLLTACGRGSSSQPPPATPVAAPPAPALDAVGEAAASYRIQAAIEPAGLPRGGKGALTIEIELLRPDVHVQAEFPLKITLAPSAGLKLGKSVLGHADAVDPAAKGRRWKVPVTVAAGGPQEVAATLRFALCKESEPAWCVTRNETVSAGVKPR